MTVSKKGFRIKKVTVDVIDTAGNIVDHREVLPDASGYCNINCLRGFTTLTVEDETKQLFVFRC
jgi:hypothetical protein